MQDRARHVHAPPDPGLPNLLEIDSRVATGMSVSTDTTRAPPGAVRSPRGTNVWVAAVNSAPRTTKNITSTNSAVAWPNRPEPGERASAALTGRGSLPPSMGITTVGWSAPACLPPAMRLASSPTVMATLSVMAIRSPTTRQSSWNAEAVDSNTTGFTTSAAWMKVVVAQSGTPLAVSHRASGITPQSHTGATKPKTLLRRTSPDRLRGSQCATMLADRYRCTAADAKTPTRRKGSDCSTMLTKTMTSSFNRAGDPRVEPSYVAVLPPPIGLGRDRQRAGQAIR